MGEDEHKVEEDVAEDQVAGADPDPLVLICTSPGMSACSPPVGAFANQCQRQRTPAARTASWHMLTSTSNDAIVCSLQSDKRLELPAR